MLGTSALSIHPSDGGAEGSTLRCFSEGERNKHRREVNLGLSDEHELLLVPDTHAVQESSKGGIRVRGNLLAGDGISAGEQECPLLLVPRRMPDAEG